MVSRVYLQANWLIHPIGYLSSSEGSIRRLNAEREFQHEFTLEHMSVIHDMEPTVDGDRIVAVGETLVRPDRAAVGESAILRKPLT